MQQKDEDKLARQCRLLMDTLSVIANHPGGDEVTEWMKAKANEAFCKIPAAQNGDIYSGVKPTDVLNRK